MSRALLRRWGGRWARRGTDERGYVAILVALLLVPLIAMAAFAVDVGQWYVTAREVQRAADAAALGGVPYLPGDTPEAFSAAQELSADNGFDGSADDVEVRTAIDKTPTQLRVTVSKTLSNHFGRLLGIDDTTITRTAVADYAGPVPLGSPCNRFGNDPDETPANASDVCDGVGQYWGNVGSLKATKVSGDAYQDNVCASGVDQCLNGRTNLDYDVNGYFYSVTLTKDVPKLVIEAFDPALIHVGDKCDKVTLSSERGARYEKGSKSLYCTGDVDFRVNGYKDVDWQARTDGYKDMVGTEFTVRDPGPNMWDPTSFPVRSTCEGTGTFRGYAKKDVLASVANDSYVARVFRQWVPLCTIDHAKAGTYLVQVKTNGIGYDSGSGHNRFSLRAYSKTNAADNEAIAISGYSKMAVFANLPDATTTFYLARVPSGAGGQILNVQLFDVGDSTTAGTIQILPPPDSGVTSFTGCQGKGVRTGALTDCTLTNVRTNHNGKWQTVSVPIPTNYRCDDLDPTDCWVRLQYRYGTGNQPTDTTSWAASIEGDPVRLIE